MTRVTKHRLPGICCPHCQAPATQRKANVLSDLVRDIYFRCENDDCGHGFVVQMAVTRTVTPSRIPNPAISLPFSDRFAVPVPANDDYPLPANDDCPIVADPLEHPAVMTG